MKFLIFIEDIQIAEVTGAEYAYAAYRKAADLADLLGKTAYLVNGNTGEILEQTDSYLFFLAGEEFDECGFDPYEGCYTYDC